MSDCNFGCMPGCIFYWRTGLAAAASHTANIINAMISKPTAVEES